MSTSLGDPTNNKNWCELIFHFLQFKIHFNLLTDEEFEFFFKNCQEYLTGKTNGYNYLNNKCLNELNLVANDNGELNEIIKNQIITNFWFLIINMFIILVVVLPVFFVFKKSYNRGLSSSNENN